MTARYAFGQVWRDSDDGEVIIAVAAADGDGYWNGLIIDAALAHTILWDINSRWLGDPDDSWKRLDED